LIALFSHTGFAGYTIRESDAVFPGEEFAVCGRQAIRRTHGGGAISRAPQRATLCLIQAKNSPPRQGEPPVRFKCPGYPVPDDLTRKGIRFQDASALRRTALPAHRV